MRLARRAHVNSQRLSHGIATADVKLHFASQTLAKARRKAIKGMWTYGQSRSAKLRYNHLLSEMGAMRSEGGKGFGRSIRLFYTDKSRRGGQDSSPGTRAQMVDAGKTQERGHRFRSRTEFDLAQNHIFVSGPQAIVRLLLMQAERDRRAGLKTAGFVSGYRGSPLGGVDLNLARAKKQLEARDIRFEPGLNEDLAATAIWGAQQAEMRGEGRFDGVFGLWYGKGPGVDRSGDVLRHVNLAGTSRFGGVLALMGDDHTAESSSTAHQSEFAFVDVMIPILAPAGVQELIDYGLYGYALSRYSGCWVGLKCLKDTVESTASVDAALDRVQPVVPTDFFLPPDGLNIRARDPVLDQEKRLQNYKRDAVLAWLRANKLNRIVMSGGAEPRLGIIAAGKSYLDVRQALDELGIDEVARQCAGLASSTRSPAPGRWSRKDCANLRKVSTRSLSSRKSGR